MPVNTLNTIIGIGSYSSAIIGAKNVADLENMEHIPIVVVEYIVGNIELARNTTLNEPDNPNFPSKSMYGTASMYFFPKKMYSIEPVNDSEKDITKETFGPTKL